MLDLDPFADTPDATISDCPTPRRRWIEKPTCELVAKGGLAPKPKKTDFNPMQRRWFERHGYTYARVEHANAFGAVNVDLWGFADYLAVKPGDILLVQVTSMSNAAARERKIRSAPEFAKWIEAGGRVEVHAWKQPGGPGSKWELVVRPVTGGEEARGDGAHPRR
jgi:hypothetical protein